MAQDVWGLEHTAVDAATVDGFSTALIRLNEFRTDTLSRLDALIAAEPGYVMAHVAKAGFLLMGGCRVVMPKVRAALTAIEAHVAGLNRRERLHVEALRCFAANDLPAACALWDTIVVEHPTDLLALRLLHHQRFWQGEARAMLGVSAAALEAWDVDLPGRGFVLGMAAFGHEECGLYDAAERLGRSAHEVNPDDMWAVHAVAHVLEMRGQAHEGRRWLGHAADHWFDRTSFKGHLWWHKALFALECRRPDEALALYDALILPKSPTAATDLQNAASLLARLEVLGIDVGDRWTRLAADAAKWARNELVPFTDVHTVLPLAKANRPELADLIASLRERAEGGAAFPGRVVADLALPLALGVVAFAEGHAALAYERLAPLRHALQPLGGSHAQRDVFHQILLEAAIRAGRHNLARSLVNERLALRPGSAIARDKLAQIEAQIGAGPSGLAA